jgi:hypothetical protein
MADETINMEVNSNIGDVVKDTDKLTKSTKKATISFGGMFDAIGKIGIVTKIFDVFKKLLGENQIVVDAMATAMNFLSVAFSDLFKFIESNIEPVTSYFKSLFEDPVGAMEDFARTMIDRVVESFNSLFESIGLVASALVKVFKGDFKGALEDVKEAGKELVDVVTGVDGSADKLVETFKKGVGAVSEYAKSTYNAAKAITAADKAADKAATTFGLLNAQLAGDAAEQERILADEFASIEDKYTALEKLTGITESLHKAEKAQVETLLKQAQLKYDLNKSDENWIALQEQKIALQELENKQSEDAEALFDKKVAINDEWNTKQDEIAVADQERRDKELEAEKELAEKKKAIRQGMFNDMQAIITSSLEAQGNQIEAEYNKEIKLAEANGKDTEDIEEKYNKKRTALAEKQKKVKIALAMIDMYQSAVAAYNQGMGVPPPAGLALAPIAAGLAVAAGLANINSIMQTDVGVGGGGGGATATVPTDGPAPQMMSGAFELSGGTEPEAFKAYVVTDEMTNSQNQLANIRRRATI